MCVLGWRDAQTQGNPIYVPQRVVVNEELPPHHQGVRIFITKLAIAYGFTRLSIIIYSPVTYREVLRYYTPFLKVVN